MPLAAIPLFISNNPEMTVASLIVFLGLLVYGFRDLIHFSFARAWAISGVCFRESVRRRVLWIIPLTIIGVIVVSQLQHPTDEQDAIRQSTKFCLFATGLVVTVTAIILACTNLPKEVESRVIYTIVTKPITRLEIVLGKVMGFARMSATILLIMGLFTLIYMQLRAWSLSASISQQLRDGTADPSTTSTLTHYRDAGLLNSRTYASSTNLQVFSREPIPGDKKRWMYGAEGNFLVPFQISRESLVPKNDSSQTPGSAGIYILARIGFDQSELAAMQQAEAKSAASVIPDVIAAPLSTSQPLAGQNILPSVTLDLLDANQNALLDSKFINGGKPLTLPDASGQLLLRAYIPPSQADIVLRSDVIYVRCRGNDSKMEYFAAANPIGMAVPLLSADDGVDPPLNAAATVINASPFPMSDTGSTLPVFSTSVGTYGVQLRGSADRAPIAAYAFRGATMTADPQGNVPMELRVGIERGGEESGDAPTQVRITIVDRTHPDHPESDSRYVSTILPEINRTSFFAVPATAVAGGNFDVYLQCTNPGQFLGVQLSSLNLVVSEHSFIFNLVKSLIVLWLLSMLVVIVAIFCSTFLSWPIAVVLTVLILLGRWAVTQLGDATAPGVGNMVATDMGLRDPSKMRAVSDSVEALAKLLNVLARVLPDISRFSALEDIERGISLPLSRLTDSLAVIAIFGIPLMVISYVFLRNKEVAP